MSYIFISHSSQDNSAAVDIKTKLKEKGYSSIFLDFDTTDLANTLLPGEKWEQQLYRQIRSCQAIVVLCSSHTDKSKWVFAEITQARSHGKPIFPIKVAVNAEVPSILKDVQSFDGNNPAEWDAFWFCLAETLKDSFPLAEGRPPYPGLTSFEEEDAALFFGRNAEAQERIEDPISFAKFRWQKFNPFLGSFW